MTLKRRHQACSPYSHPLPIYDASAANKETSCFDRVTLVLSHATFFQFWLNYGYLS